MITRWAFLLLGLLCAATSLLAGEASSGGKIVVLLHGVGGDPVTTWRHVAASGGITPEVVSFTSTGAVAGCRASSYYSVDLRLPDPPSKLAIAKSVVSAQAGRLALALEAIRNAPGNEGKSIVLVGHSRGGMVAREYLTGTDHATHPAPVSDVVFISSPHGVYATLCGNRPLPRDIKYHTLANPYDRVVWLGDQMSLETQQPGISHDAALATGWDSRLMHELEGANGADVFRYVASIAGGTPLPASLEPYTLPPASGPLAASQRFVSDNALFVGGVIGGVAGAVAGCHFGVLGAIGGCMAGSFAGAVAGVELSGHSLIRSLTWKPSSAASSGTTTPGPAQPQSTVRRAGAADAGDSSPAPDDLARARSEYRASFVTCVRTLCAGDAVATRAARAGFDAASSRYHEKLAPAR